MCLFVAKNLFEEFAGRDTMNEGLNTVNADHRDVVTIFIQQLGIGFDVDLVQNKLIAAAGAHDCRLRFVAKMTSGSRINDYVRFRHSILLASQLEN